MKSAIFRYPCFLIFFSLCLLFGFACESEMKDPKATLEKQAAQYWTDRLVKKDYKVTYKQEMEKDLPPFSTYEKKLQAASRIPTSSVKTKEVQIDGDRGTVTLLITCRIPGMPKDYDMPMRDLWLLKGNKWKHHFEIKRKSSNIPGR